MKENKNPKNPTIREGWTLRDEFAAQAMKGMIQDKDLRNLFANKGNRTNTDWMDVLSENSFYVADAMLKQREL